MLFKFALRNVLRNRRRTALTSLSIFFAALIVVLSEGWVSGALESYFKNYIDNQTGHIKIMNEEFYKRQRFFPVDALIPETPHLIEQIKKIRDVESVEERIHFGLILGRGENTIPAIGVGVDLYNSRLNLKDKIIEGSLDKNGILIGKGLAEKLGVKVGDRLLLATKTSEGGLNGIKLAISGIVEFKVTAFDKRFFFISLKNAKKLLKIYDDTTEIFVYVHNKKLIAPVKNKIKDILPKGTIALTYTEQMGSLYRWFTVSKFINFFIEALIIFLASFVIINTMAMAIFERLREIGTLKALGMTDNQLFWNFTIEGTLIGLFGGITGGFVGYLLILYLSKTGINFQKAMKNVDIPINYIFYPSPNISVFLITILLTIVITAIAAMFPARYAKKFTPAEALRKI